jgi:hypothetical protein
MNREIQRKQTGKMLVIRKDIIQLQLHIAWFSQLLISKSDSLNGKVNT